MCDGAEIENELDMIAEDVEFTRAKARELYRAGFGMQGNLTARWERICEQILFEDIVNELQGTNKSNSKISCPFHGRDSRPSFQLYRRTNDGFCFGCPEGEKYYDSVIFVSKKFGCTRGQAVSWIEKHYDLPPLEETDEEEEDEDDSETVENALTFAELTEPYLHKAAAAFNQSGDPELVRDFIAIYFAAKPDRNAALTPEEDQRRAVQLARVLGGQEIDKIIERHHR